MPSPESPASIGQLFPRRYLRQAQAEELVASKDYQPLKAGLIKKGELPKGLVLITHARRLCQQTSWFDTHAIDELPLYSCYHSFNGHRGHDYLVHPDFVAQILPLLKKPSPRPSPSSTEKNILPEFFDPEEVVHAAIGRLGISPEKSDLVKAVLFETPFTGSSPEDLKIFLQEQGVLSYQSQAPKKESSVDNSFSSDADDPLACYCQELDRFSLQTVEEEIWAGIFSGLNNRQPINNDSLNLLSFTP